MCKYSRLKVNSRGSGLELVISLIFGAGSYDPLSFADRILLRLLLLIYERDLLMRYLQLFQMLNILVCIIFVIESQFIFGQVV